MIGFRFNYDMFDAPYNQNKVKQGFNKLEKYLENIKEEMFYTFGDRRDYGFVGPDQSNDYVVIQHSNNFSKEVKQEIAAIVKEILTLNKTEYKGVEIPKCLVVFEKVEEDNYFIF